LEYGAIWGFGTWKRLGFFFYGWDGEDSFGDEEYSRDIVHYEQYCLDIAHVDIFFAYLNSNHIKSEEKEKENDKKMV